MLKPVLKWIAILLLALVVWYFGGRITAQIVAFTTGEEAVAVHPIEMIPFMPEHIKARFVPPAPAPENSSDTTPGTPDTAPGDSSDNSSEPPQPSDPDDSVDGGNGSSGSDGSAPNDDDMVACTMDAKICPDGSAVGRVGPHCEFAPCPAASGSSNPNNPSEPNEPGEPPASGDAVVCEPEQRNVDACIEIYQPVCGLTRVECFTEPCDPVPATYSNSCFACQDERVVSYTEGSCESP